MSADWKVYIFDPEVSGGGDFVIDDSNLPRPNANLQMESLATYSTVILENGDKAFVTPEKTVYYSPIQLIWTDDDGTLLDQFRGYQQDGSLLKITTHNGSYYFIGRVYSVVPEWLAGIADTDGGDLFDLAVTFDVTQTLSES